MESLFRKESLDRIESPDQMNQYLRVIGPSVWLILTAVILLLAGVLCWSASASIEGSVDGYAAVENGRMLITFEDQEKAGRIEAGMTVQIGSVTSLVDYVGYTADGSVFASADTSIRDGYYTVSVIYSRTRVLQLLMN